MIAKIKSITRDNFIRNNIIYFCGSIIVAFFNYLYHPVLGRIMGVEEFGEVQTLISLFTQLAVVGGVFAIMVVNVISNGKNTLEAERKVSVLYTIAIYVTVLIGLSLVAFSAYLKEFFQFNSVYPFIILALILFSGVSITFHSAILQALHRFSIISASQAALSLGKLAFAAILVYAGFSSLGAIAGIIIAQICVLFYISKKTGKLFRVRFRGVGRDWQVRKELNYGILVLIVSLSTAFLFTADVVVVKHYFSAQTAGLYSGISIIARIIYFATSSVAGVLLPSVKIVDQGGGNMRALKRSVTLVALIGGLILLVFSFFPSLVINLMLGSRYLAYASLLPKLSLVVFLISLSNLFFYYMLALRDYKAAIISILGAVAAVSLSIFRHGTLSDVVDNFLFASLAVMFLVFISKAKSNRKYIFAGGKL